MLYRRNLGGRGFVFFVVFAAVSNDLKSMNENDVKQFCLAIFIYLGIFCPNLVTGMGEEGSFSKWPGCLVLIIAAVVNV